MSSRRRLVLAVLVLLVLSALLVRVLERGDQATVRAGPRPGAPPYGMRGPHPVGIRDLVIDGDTPLELTLWYPASNSDSHDEAITYPYKIKMNAPLVGSIAIASYAGQAISDAPYDLATSPYPLVILSPGFSIGSTAYAWLAEHLASYGFVVIAPEHHEHLDPANELWPATITRPQDILTVLAYADEQVDAGGTLEGLIDPELVAVIGHSYGGYTALAAAGARVDTDGFAAHCETARDANDPSVWLCDQLVPHMADMAALAGLDAIPEGLWPAWADPRVDAIVPMAGDAFMFGQAGLAEITVPVLAMGGTADGDSPYIWGTHPTYEYVSSPTKVLIALDNAEHMIFTDTCNAIPWYMKILSDEFCSDTDWDRNRAHDLINHFTTAFLLVELTQDADAAAALVPATVDFPDVIYEAQGY